MEFNEETIGMLDLKIARLEQYLQVLEKQQALSEMYPLHRTRLILYGLQVQSELNQLIQRRRQLSSLPIAV
jgi:hypothetical protein